MKIELGYNAGISVYNNYKNETTLEIEDNKLLPNVLVAKILEDYGVEPLVKNLFELTTQASVLGAINGIS